MTQDLLPLTGGEMTAKRTLDVISPSLVRFLMVEATSAKDAVARISKRPELLAEAREVNARVQRLCKEVGMARAMELIAPLTLLFPPPSFGKGDAGDALTEAWHSTYAKAIADLYEEALTGAVDQWAKVGRFFPKPAELRALAEPKMTELRTLSWRVRQCAENTNMPRPPLTDAERAERQRLAEETVEMLRGITSKRVPVGERVHAP